MQKITYVKKIRFENKSWPSTANLIEDNFFYESECLHVEETELVNQTKITNSGR